MMDVATSSYRRRVFCLLFLACLVIGGIGWLGVTIAGETDPQRLNLKLSQQPKQHSEQPLQKSSFSTTTKDDNKREGRAQSVEEQTKVFRFPTELGVESENTWVGARVDEPVVEGVVAASIHKDAQNSLLVDRNHYIMADEGWDSAPFVLEDFKLIFFTVPKVGCTVFKQLFRRMSGYADWNTSDVRLTHDVQYNGLKRLSEYSVERASEIMTDPDWTRAIFVRDPKERILSAFLEKVLAASSPSDSLVRQKCCPERGACMRSVGKSFESFLWLTSQCPNPHWSPQSERMEKRYWPYINFVGRMESIETDTRTLLQRIGAWEEFGQSGWPKPTGKDPDQNNTSSTTAVFASNTALHQTGANTRVQQYYTAETERLVEKLLEKDYQHPSLHFFSTEQQQLQKLNLTDNATERIWRSVRGIERTYNNSNVSQKIQGGDWTYHRAIVVEKFKLVVIVPQQDTVWTNLLAKLMAWNGSAAVARNDTLNVSSGGGWVNVENLSFLPFSSRRNGDSSSSSSSGWTKALLLRNPKERLLSLYLSESPHRTTQHLLQHCCPRQRACVSDNRLSFDEFVEITAHCPHGSWIPLLQQQHHLLSSNNNTGKDEEQSLLSSINFVGRWENAEEDAKKLLTNVGVSTEELQRMGWCENDYANPVLSNDFMRVFYTRETETRVEEIYEADFKLLGLSQ